VLIGVCATQMSVELEEKVLRVVHCSQNYPQYIMSPLNSICELSGPRSSMLSSVDVLGADILLHTHMRPHLKTLVETAI
jgi:hypothetical protein